VTEPGAGAAVSALTPRTAAATAVGQLAGKALLLLIAFANTAIITRALGAGGYADWATVLTLTAMLGFALDPGISPPLVRRLSGTREDVPSPATLLWARIGLSALVYVVVIAASLAIRGTDAMLLAVVLAAELFPRSVVLNVAAWLQAYHRLHRQTAREVVSMGVGLALLGIAVALDAPAEVLAAVGIVVPSALLAGLSQRELRLVPTQSRGPERQALRSLVLEALPIAAAVALLSVYTRIDVVFVSAAEDAAGLAQYLLAFRFVEVLIMVAGILAVTLMPMLAARSGRMSLTADRLTHETMVAVGGLGALSGMALIAVANPAIDVLAPASLHFAADLLLLLSPVALALYLNFFLGYLMMALREGRRYLWFNSVALALNLAANAIFTPEYGSVAAARITWMTELVVVVAAMVPLARAPGGARAALKCAVLAAAAIAASELAYDGTAPVLVALVGAALTAAVAWPELVRRARDVAAHR
jgi:O-antigen/teichoic acid export membrane protein